MIYSLKGVICKQNMYVHPVRYIIVLLYTLYKSHRPKTTAVIF